MLQLSKYILLLASVVAMVTYTAGFNPPGGVWKDTVAGHLAGDPIIRSTHYNRYLVFFYCNATAFAASLFIIIGILIHNYLNSKNVRPLLAVMVVDLLCLMGAYVAGTGRDMFTTIYSSLLAASFFVYLVAKMVVGSCFTAPGSLPEVEEADELMKAQQRFRKILLILATFAVSITYTAGLSTPGGIWDTSEAGHRPGDTILKDHHNTRLTVFSGFNTAAFSASLLLIAVLLDSKIRKKIAYMVVVLTLVSLISAYIAGSCRQTGTTIYVVSLVAAFPVWIGFLLLLLRVTEALWNANSEGQHYQVCIWFKKLLKLVTMALWKAISGAQHNEAAATDQPTEKENAAGKVHSLVVLHAILVAAITYLAGLHPPGGIWLDNRDGHKAGDAILLTMKAWRYNAFYYCNSTSFAVSLVLIVLAEKKRMLRHHLFDVVKIIDMFSLIGAYVAGSSWDVWTSVLTMSMAAAILVQEVRHVVAIFITKRRQRTRDHMDNNKKNDELAQKTRKWLLLFTILLSTITYRAGLTPPGGFLLQDHQSGHNAGDPVLSYNFPHRYKAFITCNSVSFMLSTYILLRCLTLYRPATRCMLSVCKAAVLYSLMGAYAAGSSQHLKTSIYIFVLAPMVLFLLVPLFRVYLIITSASTRVPVVRAIGDSNTTSTQGVAVETNTQEQEAIKRKRIHAERKYHVLLGIIVASVTYQAGLVRPGGTWQSNSGGYEAGNPVMYDNRRTSYLIFFYSNSTSFVASIGLIVLLLVPKKLFGHHQKTWLRRWYLFLNSTIALELCGLIFAYQAGSTIDIRRTSIYVNLLFAFVLGYSGLYLVLSIISSKGIQSAQDNNDHQQQCGSQSDV